MMKFGDWRAMSLLKGSSGMQLQKLLPCENGAGVSRDKKYPDFYGKILELKIFAKNFFFKAKPKKTFVSEI